MTRLMMINKCHNKYKYQIHIKIVFVKKDRDVGRRRRCAVVKFKETQFNFIETIIHK